MGLVHRAHQGLTIDDRAQPTTGEIPLVGDGVTPGIVRIGSTVRRPVRPFTATVQAFLRALHDQGFTDAPIPLGTDDLGREVLTFVEGEVPHEPVGAGFAGDDVLTALAVLVRRQHDAARGWVPPVDAVWGGPPVPAGAAPMPALVEPDLVAHMDYCPGNVVFRDGLPAALIDFDYARPTTALLDVLNALHWWAPLLDPADRSPSLADVDVPARVRLFVDAYGLGAADREALVPLALRRAERSIVVMRAAADADPVYRRMWDETGDGRLHRALPWLLGAAPAITAKLTGPAH